MFQAFPDLDRMRRELRDEGVAYMATINALTDDAARPWTAHPSFGDEPQPAGAGSGFRFGYPDFENAP